MNVRYCLLFQCLAVFESVFSYIYLSLSHTAVCDELSAIENGRIEYAPDSTGPEYNLNTVATYICDGGFELNTETGDETRTCIDGGDGNGGVFDGQKPSCQRESCSRHIQ